ncbi:MULTISPECIES: hypothetical protein [Paenibacillus]|jgi:hypothetical protein|nr:MULTISPECIES: hypothetical protein [Paenibacillus]MDH6427249.1 hypothetical protein [Paenibacillus sp. PastH-4]MDH6443279.1 hypothetical protein [Paenibacillus sp. PastF-4]MDH6526017.1 hypothetical protein [Paenibacillus sp. PastH-3]
MKVRYAKWHNNYDLVIGEEYQASRYKPGWLLIDGVLYRSEHFEVGEEAQ